MDRLTCDSTYEFLIKTFPYYEWSRMRYSHIGVECMMFRWCRWAQKVLWWWKIWSRLGLEDGISSSWRFPCSRGVREASTDRSFLGGEWARPPWCYWWSLLCDCGHPQYTPPQLWKQFVAREIAQLPSLHEKDTLPRCEKFACLDSRGRLCRPGWWADLSESGKKGRVWD